MKIPFSYTKWPFVYESVIKTVLVVKKGNKTT